MPQNGIQDELAELSRLCEALKESHRQFVCDRRLPENSRLMEIRATNRELLENIQKVNHTKEHFLSAYNLVPLDNLT